MWSASTLNAHEVEYSPDGIFSERVPARTRIFDSRDIGRGEQFVQYSADLSGLSPSTQYMYRIVIDGDPVLSRIETRFTTSGPGPFRFLVLGDSGEASPPQFQLAQRLIRDRPSLLLHAGDIAYYEGGFHEFRANYFQRYQMMRSVPFFPTPGNHEYLTADAAPYRALHSFPAGNVPAADRGRYYSFDWSNVHFVSLDSNRPLERAAYGDGEMLRWLDDDLRNTRQFWRVVFFHHPPYAFGPNQTNTFSALARELIVPILERYGVQIVFSGHEHSYQRSLAIRKGVPSPDGTGVTYFTCGGGGGQLYPVFASSLLGAGASEYHYLRVDVGGTRMRVRAVGLDGEEIETHLLQPKPSFSNEGFGPSIWFKPWGTGAQVHIVGNALAPEEIYATSVSTFAEKIGILVTVNGRPIPLYYASSTEIYGYVPFPLEGSVTVRVTTANGFTEASVPVSQLAALSVPAQP
jgi:hypothetical protein